MENTIKTSVGKSFFKFISLNILSSFVFSFYILADVLFVANGVGGDGLTALNIILPFFALLNGTGIILGIGGATRYSTSKGAGKDDLSKRIFTQVFIIGCFMGAIYTLAGTLFPSQIARLLGADDQIIELATTYLRSIAIFGLPFVINHILIAFVKNDDAPKLAMFAVVFSSLFNILFDWVAIYPCKMGIFGAGFVTGLSSVVSILIMCTHFIRKKNKFFFIKPRFYWSDIKFALAAGFPSMINEMSNGIVILVFNNLIYSLAGNAGINAYSVVANISLVAAGTFTGISQGVQPLFSYNYGANKPKNINKLFAYSIIVAVCLSVAFFIGFYFAREPIIKLFNKEGVEEITVLAKQAVTLYNIMFFASGINIVIMTLFASCGKPFSSITISLLRGLILPISFSFLMAHLWELTGIWLTMPVGEFVTLLVAIVLMIGSSFLRKRRKQKSTLQIN